MVLNMPNSRDWDVTIGCRIEEVTNQDGFAELFLGALSKSSAIAVIESNLPSWPHTTSVVIGVAASRKKDAESVAKTLVLPVLLDVAKVLGSDQPMGWTMSLDAKVAFVVAP
jgi:hypothetical protein